MKIEAKAGIRNEFKVKVDTIDKRNPIRNLYNRLVNKVNTRFNWNIPNWYKIIKTEELLAYNIVLNSMWSRLVNFQPYFVNIHFGTGTGPFDDRIRTGLYTYLGTKAAVTELQERDLPTSRWVRRIVLNPEEFVGQAITEVGVAYGTAQANIVTHAAIQDAEGNPISMDPKTDTQIVTIYATIYMTLGADSSYGDKIRLVQPLANNQWLTYLMGGTYPTQQWRVTRAPLFGDGTAPASTGQSANILVADWIKDAANKKVTTPVPSTRRLGTTVGNGEVRGFGLGSSDAAGTFRGQFPIPGVFTSNAKTGKNLGSGDGSKVGFNLPWNDPQSLAVKVDGDAVDVGDYDVLPVKKGTNLFLYRDVNTLSGSISAPQNLTDGSVSTTTTLPTGSAVGIDLGENALSVDTFRVYIVSSAGSFARVEIYGSNNADFSNSQLVAPQFVMGVNNTWFASTVSPVTYRYYRITKTEGGATQTFGQVEALSAADQITFTTPPANGAAITADYTLDYIPKDENHVLDLQCAIQYGEVT